MQHEVDRCLTRGSGDRASTYQHCFSHVCSHSGQVISTVLRFAQARFAGH
jgi:hypothetical protein